MTGLEILIPHEPIRMPRTAVLDFDGTVSKLRSGWETVMGPLMEEFIPGDADEVRRLVTDYIDQSTGIQTIRQMKWLAKTVAERGGKPLDPWAYKDEYNRRLMIEVGRRRSAVRAGEEERESYLVCGAEGFLARLRDGGARILAASGTDEEDVIAEADALGVSTYFDGIYGAKRNSELCSKEAVLETLVTREDRLFVAGDGKVEIALGRRAGAVTLGLCTNDIPGDNSHTAHPAKIRRLTDAGAHALAPDFADTDAIFQWM